MTSERRRRGGCRGCGLILVLLVIAVIVWAAIVPFRVLQRVGLQESPAERYLGGPPDREAAEILANRLRASGMGMQGVQVQVLELSNTGERVAFTVLDATQGFDFLSVLEGDTADDSLSSLADLVADLDIERLAVFYVDEDGESLFTLTHEVEAIQALERGTISDREFMEGLNIDFDARKLLGEVLP